MVARATAEILVAWIGFHDLAAPGDDDPEELGPIARAVRDRVYDRVELLSSLDSTRPVDAYCAWLAGMTDAPIGHHPVRLRAPTDFADIYRAATGVVDSLAALPGAALSLHLSPGTSAMAAIWLILAKTRYFANARLIEASRAHGVRDVSFPFELSAELVPDLMRRSDAALIAQSVAAPPEAPEFAAIIRRSAIMERVVARARQVAARAVPVLIEGETGTGKELLARAIHRASPRAERPFVAVNCGAIAPGLIESTLFGHVRGAFTGAINDRGGVFEAANRGTLFLDELGELPRDAQVKLLRVLQEGTVTRVGAVAPRRVDARVIAATHRSMVTEVAEGRFREDLFYRLAVAVLRLPPLRERKGELSMLIAHLLKEVQAELAVQPGFAEKRLTPKARQLLLEHRWPGNVRELRSTLLRAALWSDGRSIGVEAVREAMFPAVASSYERVLERPLGDGFELEAVRDEIAAHYIRRALAETAGNKTKAARLLGYANYQTLTNRMNRLGI